MKNSIPSFKTEDDVFRTRLIQRHELPWIRRRHIWTGILGNIYGTFLGPAGIYFTFFCLSMGMTKYQIGIMSSLISISVISQLFSWIFEDKWGNRKYPWYLFSIISRLCFLPIIFSFWIPLGPISVVVLCVISAIFGNLSVPPWSSWLYDIIPEDQLARFMARRSSVIQLFILALAIFASLAMQRSTQTDKLMIVRLVFTFGLTLGIIDIIFHAHIPEPPSESAEMEHRLMKVIFQPCMDRKFWFWMMITSLWAFSVGIASPFFIPYLMKDLGFENRFIELTLIAVCLVQISGFFSLLLWGRIIERLGARNVLILCHCMWSLVPLFYILSIHFNASILISLAWIDAGIFVNGALIANQAILSKLTKGKKRSIYLALIAIVSMVLGGLGMLIGSLIVKFFYIELVFSVSLISRILVFLIILVILFRVGIDTERIADKTNKA